MIIPTKERKERSVFRGHLVRPAHATPGSALSHLSRSRACTGHWSVGANRSKCRPCLRVDTAKALVRPPSSMSTVGRAAIPPTCPTHRVEPCGALQPAHGAHCLQDKHPNSWGVACPGPAAPPPPQTSHYAKSAGPSPSLRQGGGRFALPGRRYEEDEEESGDETDASLHVNVSGSFTQT